MENKIKQLTNDFQNLAIEFRADYCALKEQMKNRLQTLICDFIASHHDLLPDCIGICWDQTDNFQNIRLVFQKFDNKGRSEKFKGQFECFKSYEFSSIEDEAQYWLIESISDFLDDNSHIFEFLFPTADRVLITSYGIEKDFLFQCQE